MSLLISSLLSLAFLVGVLALALLDRRWLAYLFFLRVPLVAALTLVAFPVVARGSGVLGNLMVMSWRGFFALAFFSPLGTWVIGLTSAIIWRRAEERFGVAKPRFPAWMTRLDRTSERLLGWLEPRARIEPPIEMRQILWFGLLAAPLLILTLMQSATVRHEAPWGHLLSGALGVALAVGALWLIDRLNRKLVGSGGLAWLARVLEPLFRRLPGLRPGYVEEQSDGSFAYRPGHGFAFIMTGLLAALYLFGAVFFEPEQVWYLKLPTLHYLLILCMLVVAALSGITFFFDRFRLPVLVAVGILILAFNLSRGLDYRFHLWRPDAAPPEGMSERARDSTPATAEEVVDSLLEAAPSHPGRPKPALVVVAAAGGGIQAAAWTARALTGLQQELGPQLAHSIGLISAVSGGSVGAMYYLAAFRDGSPPGLERLAGTTSGLAREPIFEAAASSSLDATVWGLVFRDLPRLLWPGRGPDNDRAWAMERSWAQSWRQMVGELWDAPGTPEAGTRLSHWIADVKRGARPAVVMNVMLAESSKRLLIGSTETARSPDDAVSFSEFCCAGEPGADIDIVTAARASATFPYITPMARPEWDDHQTREPYVLPDQRVADGGYYDNLGVLTAVEWLEEMLATRSESFSQVILIEIDAFPRRAKPALGLAGLLAETVGPFAALLRARVPVQRGRNEFLIDELEEDHPGLIRRVTLRPEAGISVLSWHLSPQEKGQLLAQWDEVRCRPGVQALKALFPQGPDNPHLAEPCP